MVINTNNIKNDQGINFLDKIKNESVLKLEELIAELKDIYPKNRFYRNICVYACGSLGRLDMIDKSDLDLFFIIVNEKIMRFSIISSLQKHLFFKKLYEANDKLGYQKPSKNGYYLRFTPKANLLDIGSQEEDYNNSFTARLLLILESRPIYNKEAYELLVKEVVDVYFTDYPKYKGNFNPQFLMNDIWRYWYTLTLNYEYRRDPSDERNKKYWRRLKLKYARFITCFSLLACLYKKHITPDYVIECIGMTPFERLYMLSSNNHALRLVVGELEKKYTWFLQLRNEGSRWWDIPGNKDEAFNNADEFHAVFKKFMNEMSEDNPQLHYKTEIW